jgi:hypothetical protein
MTLFTYTGTDERYYPSIGVTAEPPRMTAAGFPAGPSRIRPHRILKPSRKGRHHGHEFY